jgi:gentisate 1,2-dioxygenase
MIASDSLEALFSDLHVANSEALWEVISKVNPKDPAPKAVAHVWPYEAMRPLLMRAGSLVGTDQAERRVAMLINPGIGKIPFTTDTIYAGLQLIMPGEVARAHKHTAFALRFIIEGDSAYTAVGGARVTMHPGDVILTPPWEFHDHGNDSDKPMIWLDGLDVPIYQWLPAHFTRFFKEEQYPSEEASRDSHLVYPWAEMQPKLDAAGGPFATAPYVHRITGGPISRTIGASAERIDANASSPARRETTSTIYHVVAGSGRTRAGDVDLVWKKGDTFVIPAWSEFVHTNGGAERAYLFRYDDRPLQEALGIYRTSEPE